jgi:hypothetical protein
MFFSKSEIERLEREISNVWEKFEFFTRNISQYLPTRDFVECEVCGCLLKASTAHKGKGEIRKTLRSGEWIQQTPPIEYIYYPHYCKVHIPKLTAKK